MFKNRKRDKEIKRAHKEFEKILKDYQAFLNEMISMGYGKHTNADLEAEGRHDLVLKNKGFVEKIGEAKDDLWRAYDMN